MTSGCGPCHWAPRERIRLRSRRHLGYAFEPAVGAGTVVELREFGRGLVGTPGVAAALGKRAKGGLC